MFLTALALGVSVDCPNIVTFAKQLKYDIAQPANFATLSIDCCNSAGIICVTNRVVNINWASKGLTGTINGSLLTNKITDLALDDNSITGPLPILPASLILINVFISNNQITGYLDTKYPNTITRFFASNNLIQGTITTAWIPNSIRYLFLDGNIMSGTIGNVFPSTLLQLYLFGNAFTGPVPPVPTLLVYFDVGATPGNLFTGTLTLGRPTRVNIDGNYITNVVITDSLSLANPYCQMKNCPLLGNSIISTYSMCDFAGAYSPSLIPGGATSTSSQKTTNVATLTSTQALTSIATPQVTTSTSTSDIISPVTSVSTSSNAILTSDTLSSVLPIITTSAISTVRDAVTTSFAIPVTTVPTVFTSIDSTIVSPLTTAITTSAISTVRDAVTTSFAIPVTTSTTIVLSSSATPSDSTILPPQTSVVTTSAVSTFSNRITLSLFIPSTSSVPVVTSSPITSASGVTTSSSPSSVVASVTTAITSMPLSTSTVVSSAISTIKTTFVSPVTSKLVQSTTNLVTTTMTTTSSITSIGISSLPTTVFVAPISSTKGSGLASSATSARPTTHNYQGFSSVLSAMKSWSPSTLASAFKTTNKYSSQYVSVISKPTASSRVGGIVVTNSKSQIVINEVLTRPVPIASKKTSTPVTTTRIALFPQIYAKPAQNEMLTPNPRVFINPQLSERLIVLTTETLDASTIVGIIIAALTFGVYILCIIERKKTAIRQFSLLLVSLLLFGVMVASLGLWFNIPGFFWFRNIMKETGMWMATLSFIAYYTRIFLIIERPINSKLMSKIPNVAITWWIAVAFVLTPTIAILGASLLTIDNAFVPITFGCIRILILLKFAMSVFLEESKLLPFKPTVVLLVLSSVDLFLTLPLEITSEAVYGLVSMTALLLFLLFAFSTVGWKRNPVELQSTKMASQMNSISKHLGPLFSRTRNATVKNDSRASRPS